MPKLYQLFSPLDNLLAAQNYALKADSTWPHLPFVRGRQAQLEELSPLPELAELSKNHQLWRMLELQRRVWKEITARHACEWQAYRESHSGEFTPDEFYSRQASELGIEPDKFDAIAGTIRNAMPVLANAAMVPGSRIGPLVLDRLVPAGPNDPVVLRHDEQEALLVNAALKSQLQKAFHAQVRFEAIRIGRHGLPNPIWSEVVPPRHCLGDVSTLCSTEKPLLFKLKEVRGLFLNVSGARVVQGLLSGVSSVGLVESNVESSIV